MQARSKNQPEKGSILHPIPLPSPNEPDPGLKNKPEIGSVGQGMGSLLAPSSRGHERMGRVALKTHPSPHATTTGSQPGQHPWWWGQPPTSWELFTLAFQHEGGSCPHPHQCCLLWHLWSWATDPILTTAIRAEKPQRVAAFTRVGAVPPSWVLSWLAFSWKPCKLYSWGWGLPPPSQLFASAFLAFSREQGELVFSFSPLPSNRMIRIWQFPIFLLGPKGPPWKWVWAFSCAQPWL